MARLVAMSKLAVHATAPSEEIPIRGHGRSVVRSTRYLDNNLPRQRLGDPRDVLPTIVAVPETAVISSSPGY